MMHPRKLSETELFQELCQEARDAIDDRVARLNDILTNCKKGKGNGIEALKTVRHDVHSLKGLGMSFGFPVITAFAHRLEDYLSGITSLEGDQECDVTLQFVDRLHDAAEHHLDAGNDEIAQLVRRLPANWGASFDIEDIVATDVEVMLVIPAGLAGRLVADELKGCGYRVVSVTDPFEAIRFAVSTRPDIMIVSAVLEHLDGIDLVCALKSMRTTKDIPVGLLTSLDDQDERLKLLPTDVPVLHKGHSFGDDIADAFSRLGII